MTLSQGHWSKVKVKMHILVQPCPDHKFSLSAWIEIIFHRNVDLHPTKCHDLKPRSLVKCKGHNAQWFLLCPDHKFSLSAWVGIIFHRTVALGPRKCCDLEPRSLVRFQGRNAHSGFNFLRTISFH